MSTNFFVIISYNSNRLKNKSKILKPTRVASHDFTWILIPHIYQVMRNLQFILCWSLFYFYLYSEIEYEHRNYDGHKERGAVTDDYKGTECAEEHVQPHPQHHGQSVVCRLHIPRETIHNAPTGSRIEEAHGCFHHILQHCIVKFPWSIHHFVRCKKCVNHDHSTFKTKQEKLLQKSLQLNKKTFFFFF